MLFPSPIKRGPWKYMCLSPLSCSYHLLVSDMKALRRLLSRFQGWTLKLGTASADLQAIEAGLFPKEDQSAEISLPYPGSNTGETQSTDVPANDQSSFFQGVGRMDINTAHFVQVLDPSTLTQASESTTFVHQNTSTGNLTNASYRPRIYQSSHFETAASRAPYEIYYEQLLKQKRGSPLWCPGPSSNLPLLYRENGVNIGDVGVFRIDEPFDFLFNIFLPADHPINAEGVPDSFRPLPPGEDIFETRCDNEGGYIGGSSVSRTNSHGDQRRLTFESCFSEGAVLVTPEGAQQKAVRSLKRMKDYMTQVAVESWYNYAMNARGRDVRNGEIHLVYACDKAASWGIAAFSSIECHTTTLEFKEVDHEEQKSRGHNYHWVCNGSANIRTKVGPFADEGTALGGSQPLQNQCIFFKSLNAQLSKVAWRHVEGVSVQVDDVPRNRVSFSAGASNRSAAGRGRYATTVMRASSRLNQCLLESYPHAKMVITTDDDWISLKAQDGEQLAGQQLFSLIQRSRQICLKDCVVSLESLESRYNGIQKPGSMAMSPRRSNIEDVLKVKQLKPLSISNHVNQMFDDNLIWSLPISPV